MIVIEAPICCAHVKRAQNFHMLVGRVSYQNRAFIYCFTSIVIFYLKVTKEMFTEIVLIINEVINRFDSFIQIQLTLI